MTAPSAGVPVWIDNSAQIAHTKTMAIDDGAVTLSGSYNWTASAVANSEDLSPTASAGVAEAYAAH